MFSPGPLPLIVRIHARGKLVCRLASCAELISFAAFQSRCRGGIVTRVSQAQHVLHFMSPYDPKNVDCPQQPQHDYCSPSAYTDGS